MKGPHRVSDPVCAEARPDGFQMVVLDVAVCDDSFDWGGSGGSLAVAVGFSEVSCFGTWALFHVRFTSWEVRRWNALPSNPRLLAICGSGGSLSAPAEGDILNVGDAWLHGCSDYDEICEAG